MALAAGSGRSPKVASGQDFRIDSELYVVGEKEPFQETLTIFTQGRVYDFVLTEPKETTVFDSQRGRFTLLDESQRLRTDISTQDVLDYALALSTQSAQSKDELFKFAAVPAFEPAYREYEENGQQLSEIKLIGPVMQYVAVGRHPERPEMAKAYRFFADWYARLNAAHGNLPPEARLELNKQLADHDLIPSEVTRTIVPANPLAKKIEVRSKHLVNWTLSATDHTKIETASDQMVNFRTVSFKQYRAAPAAGQDGKR
jgi:hypothetical protein